MERTLVECAIVELGEQIVESGAQERPVGGDQRLDLEVIRQRVSGALEAYPEAR